MLNNHDAKTEQFTSLLERFQNLRTIILHDLAIMEDFILPIINACPAARSLKRLKLHSVQILHDWHALDILNACPVLSRLCLLGCRELVEVRLELGSLKSVDLDMCVGLRSVRFECDSLTNLQVRNKCVHLCVCAVDCSLTGI